MKKQNVKCLTDSFFWYWLHVETIIVWIHKVKYNVLVKLIHPFLFSTLMWLLGNLKLQMLPSLVTVIILLRDNTDQIAPGRLTSLEVFRHFCTCIPTITVKSMYPLTHPGKMHHDKMAGGGKGVLVFCKVAKGRLGRAGGRALLAPGWSSVPRQVTQFWRNTQRSWHSQSQADSQKAMDPGCTHLSRSAPELRVSVPRSEDRPLNLTQRQNASPQFKLSNPCFPSPAHGDLSILSSPEE